MFWMWIVAAETWTAETEASAKGLDEGVGIMSELLRLLEDLQDWDNLETLIDISSHAAS